MAHEMFALRQSYSLDRCEQVERSKIVTANNLLEINRYNYLALIPFPIKLFLIFVFISEFYRIEYACEFETIYHGWKALSLQVRYQIKSWFI